MDFLDQLRNLNREAMRLGEEKIGKFAVLMPLMKIDNEYHVLFQTRGGNVNQPGEVCFPGGHQEKGETFVETAIRETMEELYVERDQIEVLTPIDWYEAPSGRKVVPFVAELTGYNYTYNEAEVKNVFTVPLKWFYENTGDRYFTDVLQRPREDFPLDKINAKTYGDWKIGTIPIYFYYWEDNVIWGLTARILHEAVEVFKELGIEP